jgi:hypothetical protein
MGKEEGPMGLDEVQSGMSNERLDLWLLEADKPTRANLAKAYVSEHVRGDWMRIV